MEIELIGAFALEGTGAEGDFAVGGIGVFAGESVGFVDFVAFVFTIVCGEGSFDAGVGFAGGNLCATSALGGIIGVDFLAFAAGGGFALEVVAVGVDDDDLVAEGGDFKTVFVGDEDEVFALKSGDAAAADRVEKTNFVSDVHKVGMFGAKVQKNPCDTSHGNKKSPSPLGQRGDMMCFDRTIVLCRYYSAMQITTRF